MLPFSPDARGNLTTDRRGSVPREFVEFLDSDKVERKDIHSGSSQSQGVCETTLPATTFCPADAPAPDWLRTANAYRLASMARPRRAIL